MYFSFIYSLGQDGKMTSRSSQGCRLSNRLKVEASRQVSNQNTK